MGVFGYCMEQCSKGSQDNKRCDMEMISNEMIIDYSVILAFLWFGLSLVKWGSGENG